RLRIGPDRRARARGNGRILHNDPHGTSAPVACGAEFTESGTPSPREGAMAWRSAHRRCVLQTTLVPQGIEATLDLQLAAGTDVAIEDFRIVADLLDDLYGPVLRQLQVLAEVTLGAQQAGDVRVLGGLGHLFHVGR